MQANIKTNQILSVAPSGIPMQLDNRTRESIGKRYIVDKELGLPNENCDSH
jgi:hypothetical protein